MGESKAEGMRNKVVVNNRATIWIKMKAQINDNIPLRADNLKHPYLADLLKELLNS